MIQILVSWTRRIVTPVPFNQARQYPVLTPWASSAVDVANLPVIEELISWLVIFLDHLNASNCLAFVPVSRDVSGLDPLPTSFTPDAALGRLVAPMLRFPKQAQAQVLPVRMLFESSP
jgi:hypothetical protein